MTKADPMVTAVFILYLLVMLAIGIFFYRRNENVASYFLGDRKLNRWVTALSAEASDMSGWLMMGLPGFAYLNGLSGAWIALGLAVGTYINWKWIARPLRLYTEAAGNAITLPDFLEARFADGTRVLRATTALFTLLFFLIYTASGFVASAKLFSATFGLTYPVALAAGMIVVVSYTFMGGFNAVCWTDLVQGIMMFFAIIAVPAMTLFALGGTHPLHENLLAADPKLLDWFGTARGLSPAAAVMTVISLLAWGLGYFGQPHILVRFMAIHSADAISGARRIAMGWVIVTLAAAVAIGLMGRAYLTPMLEGAQSERVFILLSQDLFPPVITGILLSAILAAIMSTADSQLLVTASAVTQDLYRAMRHNASERELVWLSRVTVLAVSAIAGFIALDPENSVLDLVSYAWAGFGATFGPVIVFSLLWRRATRWGALAGIVTGGVTVLIWKQLEGGIFDLYEIVPGFVFSCVAIVAASLLSGPPPQKVEALFDQVHQQSPAL